MFLIGFIDCSQVYMRHSTSAPSLPIVIRLSVCVGVGFFFSVELKLSIM